MIFSVFRRFFFFVCKLKRKWIKSRLIETHQQSKPNHLPAWQGEIFHPLNRLPTNKSSAQWQAWWCSQLCFDVPRQSSENELEAQHEAMTSLSQLWAGVSSPQTLDIRVFGGEGADLRHKIGNFIMHVTVYLPLWALTKCCSKGK